MSGWAVEAWHEPAAAVHHRPMPEPVIRTVWVCDPVDRALVLGSSQPDDHVDRSACDDAGVAVVRRHSGGGAVLVEPDVVLWVDVLIPAGDPLWEPDVGKAFHWLGTAWAEALDDVGIQASVHRGPLVRTRWSDWVCFAGLGPGELTDPSGRKLVGMSQRRTRAGARFQCAALAHWDPAALVGLLAATPPSRAEMTADLADAVAGVGDLTPLREALLTRLP